MWKCVHSGRRLVQAAGPKATAPDAQLPACRGGTEEWARVRASLADLMQGRGQGWTHERSLAPYRMLGGAIGCSFCCEIVRRLLLLPLPTLPVASIAGHLWSRRDENGPITTPLECDALAARKSRRLAEILPYWRALKEPRL